MLFYPNIHPHLTDANQLPRVGWMLFRQPLAYKPSVANLFSDVHSITKTTFLATRQSFKLFHLKFTIHRVAFFI